MEERLKIEVKCSVKLRFMKKISWQRAPYFIFYDADVNLVLKIRLNMIDIYENFKGDITKERLCIHCILTMFSIFQSLQLRCIVH